MVPPTPSASKNTPPRNVPTETITEQIPGADFSVNSDPAIRPIEINISAEGMLIRIATQIPRDLSSTPVIFAITAEAIIVTTD